VTAARAFRRAFLLCLAVPALTAAGPAAPPKVVTDAGAVAGAWLAEGAAFRSIPFAAPPVGPLRWRPPQPAAAWRETRAADRFGPVCPQPGSAGTPPAAQSEDCLTLNVFTPDPKAKGLPVVVNIHGGAFFVGSGRLGETEVAPLLRQGVVIVSPNYRLGRLGFFAHPALDRTRGAEPFGNYWLMDQIAALDWVKRNIARFGGDPSNVTLLGCSAGGSSVAALMASPVSRGLFARASVHSGGGLFNATHPLAEAEAQGLEFARRVGVSGRGRGAAEALRALSVAQVLAGDPGAPAFGAIVDGRLLPDHISRIFAEGRQAHALFISGSTSNEASVFGLMGFDKAVLKARFGVDLDALRAAYDPQGLLPEAELLRQVQTDFIFTSAGLGMSRLAARSGEPAYAYYFDYVATARRGTTPGVPHCGDMAYLFGNLEAPSAEDAAISRIVQSYFVNFVRKGDPNGPGLPAWPRTSDDRSIALVIGQSVRAEANFRDRQLAPWYAKWGAERGLRLPASGTP
jgi:para-nitrobenzyl esterase